MHVWMGAVLALECVSPPKNTLFAPFLPARTFVSFACIVAICTYCIAVWRNNAPSISQLLSATCSDPNRDYAHRLRERTLRHLHSRERNLLPVITSSRL